jgi:branched-chain amino acid transport system permease protein
VLALALGLPTLRLRADYLAIVTIVAAEILRFVFRSVWAREVTGGSFGRTGFAREFYAINPFPAGSYGIQPVRWVVLIVLVLYIWRLIRRQRGGASGVTTQALIGRGMVVGVGGIILFLRIDLVQFTERGAWILVVGWTLAALLTLFVWRLSRSPWGRVLRAIREDEDAATSLGKNVFAYKMQSLILGGVMGGLGGIILATSQQSVQPDAYSPPITFFIFTALILGGASTVIGPIIGSMIFWALLAATNSALRQAVGTGRFPEWLMDGVQVGQVRFMLVGLGLMLLMIYRPQGIFGDRRELALER